MLLLSAFFYVYSANQHVLEAAPDGYQDLSAVSAVNKVDDSGSNVEIPGDYGAMFKLTEKISYKPFGARKVVKAAGSSKVYCFNPEDSYPEKGVWIYNAGIYEGRSIDLKLVIDEMRFKQQGYFFDRYYPNFNFVAVSYEDRDNDDDTPAIALDTWGDAFLFLGSSGYSSSGFSDLYYEGDFAAYHYEFYDSKTKLPVSFKGTWNYNNINGIKAVSTKFDSDFSSFYIKSNSWLGYKEDTPSTGSIEFYGTNSDVNDPRGLLTHLFSGTSYHMTMERRKLDGGLERNGMGVMYNRQSLARVAPSKPIIYAEKNTATHTDPDYLKLKYSILQNVADNIEANRNTKFYLETAVDPAFDINVSDIRVFEYGTTTDLTSEFYIQSVPGNANRAILFAKDPTSEAFNGSTFDIRVTASPNASFSFKDDRYQYQHSGTDTGHMLFELGGATTKAYYEYKSLFSGDLISEAIPGQTTAKVLYEGIPSAKAKQGLSVEVGTNFPQDYPDPTVFVEDIQVDTNNDLDRPVTVSYGANLPSTTHEGLIQLPVRLTSAKGVTRDLDVPIQVVSAQSQLTVKFLVNQSFLPEFPDIVKPYVVGTTVDLTQLSEVIAQKNAILAAGYQLDSAPPSETNITIQAGGTEVVYVFVGKIFIKSAPTVLEFPIQDYANTVQNLLVEKPSFVNPLVISDTRVNKKKWDLKVKVTKPLTSVEDGSFVLNQAIAYKNGTKITPLGIQSELIVQHTNTSVDYGVSDQLWHNGNGFILQLPAGSVHKLGKYRGTVLFELGNTP